MIKIIATDFQSHKDTIVSIRYEVFVVEQKVPESLECDEHDEICQHVLLYKNNTAIGTGRLLEDGKIGRVAVISVHRRKDYGKTIITKLEEMARASGHQLVYLYAQEKAISFYHKLGYESRGESFIDAGIDHIQMIKPL